jgi:hypothetical protein
VVAGRRGPEEVAARNLDGGPGEDGGSEARTTVGRRQDVGGHEWRRWIWGRQVEDAPGFRLSPLSFVILPLT